MSFFGDLGSKKIHSLGLETRSYPVLSQRIIFPPYLFNHTIEMCCFHICRHWFDAVDYEYAVEKWQNCPLTL
jgi:hypothetical protein